MVRNQLKAEMARKGIKQKDMAESLGISIATFNRRVDEDALTVVDLRVIAKMLSWDVVYDVFFDNWRKEGRMTGTEKEYTDIKSWSDEWLATMTGKLDDSYSPCLIEAIEALNEVRANEDYI